MSVAQFCECLRLRGHERRALGHGGTRTHVALCARYSADLLKDCEHVELGALLDYLAAGQALKCHALRDGRLARRRDPGEGAALGPRHGVADGHGVALGHHLIGRPHQIRERFAIGGDDTDIGADRGVRVADT